jgi:hypothetical protein
LDGIWEATHLVVLEPLRNYGNLLQLRARVARTGSHLEAEKASVCILEYVARQDWKQFMTKIKTKMSYWDKRVFPTLEAALTPQSSSPDELLMEKLNQQRAFMSSFTKATDRM